MFGTNGSELSVGTGEGLVAGDGLLAEKREPSLSDDGRLTWDWTLHCSDRISSADSAVMTSAVFANVETPLCTLDEDPGELAVRLFNMSGWNSGCRRACLFRWSLLINRLSQIGHTNFFSPGNADLMLIVTLQCPPFDSYRIFKRKLIWTSFSLKFN